MSAENVELIRRSFAAYDESGLDGLAEFWHPDISWRAAEGALDDVGVLQGLEAMRDHHRQWEETFDEIRAEVDELIDAGDRVIAVVQGIGRMKGSDAEISLRYAIVFGFRDGKISSGREYLKREEAFEAAGLAEASEER